MAHPNKSEAVEGQSSKINKLTAGAQSGEGRLQKIAKQKAADAKEAE